MIPLARYGHLRVHVFGQILWHIFCVIHIYGVLAHCFIFCLVPFLLGRLLAVLPYMGIHHEMDGFIQVDRASEQHDGIS